MKLSKDLKKKIVIIGVGVAISLASIVAIGNTFDIAVVSSVADVITYPFQKGITSLSQKIEGVSRYFENLDTLIVENEKLSRENEKLLYENAILGQYKDENDYLKSLLDIGQRYKDYPSVGANIIAKDPGNWYQRFTIDKGSTDGIRKNDVILAGGGLVGHVIEVTAFSATVEAIIDDRSAVSGKIVRTGDLGMLKGDIELIDQGICKMELDIASDVVKGDQIITSHLGDIYPPGIPIGIVEEVTTGKNGLTQYAYIKPFIDFKHLSNVLVITQKEGVTP
ncbi:MAG: rod shape-determining protein MreC [Cellulosilyticaceae bacterium]